MVTPANMNLLSGYPPIVIGEEGSLFIGMAAETGAHGPATAYCISDTPHQTHLDIVSGNITWDTVGDPYLSLKVWPETCPPQQILYAAATAIFLASAGMPKGANLQVRLDDETFSRGTIGGLAPREALGRYALSYDDGIFSGQAGTAAERVAAFHPALNSANHPERYAQFN